MLESSEQGTHSPGIGDLTCWRGAGGNPDSTGEAEVFLGHTVPVIFLPLLPKEQSLMMEFGGTGVLPLSTQKGQACLGSR